MTRRPPLTSDTADILRQSPAPFFHKMARAGQTSVVSAMRNVRAIDVPRKERTAAGPSIIPAARAVRP